MIALASLALLQAESLHLTVGDSWTATRTIHYVSREADIDLQDDDQFTYRVDKQDDSLLVRVSRHTVGTHLSSGVYLPAPAGEPESWIVPVSADGSLKLDGKPMGKLETLLCKIVLATWNGSGKAVSRLIQVTPTDATHEHVIYDEAPLNSELRIEGDATLDPTSHAPLSIHMKGRQVSMPSGSDRVTIEVNYEARKAGKDKTIFMSSLLQTAYCKLPTFSSGGDAQ